MMRSKEHLHDGGHNPLIEELTKEMLEELQETFELASEGGISFPATKLPLVLKSLGMSLNDLDNHKPLEGDIDWDKFIHVVVACLKKPNWAANEMSESYALFDKDALGNIGPQELRVVFARLGENLLEREVEDQLKEFDMDGDLMVCL